MQTVLEVDQSLPVGRDARRVDVVIELRKHYKSGREMQVQVGIYTLERQLIGIPFFDRYVDWKTFLIRLNAVHSLTSTTLFLFVHSFQIMINCLESVQIFLINQACIVQETEDGQA